MITLSSTAAFFGILYKKNIIAIKYKYSNYFDEFLTNKYLKFVDNKKYKMITIENIDCIDYFFSGDIEEQRSNFNKFFNE